MFCFVLANVLMFEVAAFLLTLFVSQSVVLRSFSVHSPFVLRSHINGERMGKRWQNTEDDLNEM